MLGSPRPRTAAMASIISHLMSAVIADSWYGTVNDRMGTTVPVIVAPDVVFWLIIESVEVLVPVVVAALLNVAFD